jgi:hypothetical protein
MWWVLAVALVAQVDTGADPGLIPRPSSGPSSPAETETRRYELRPTREGGYDYTGPEFAAHIAPDGTVAFRGRDVQIVPETSVQDVGRNPITSEDPYDLRSGQLPIAVEARPGVRFDVTDEYLRLLGKDPARQQKSDFLAATFDMRMDMAKTANRVRSRAALDELPGRLEQIWTDPRLTGDEKRHLIRAQWDDLGEGQDADAARSVIRNFARQHLPPEDAAAFQVDSG